LRGCPCLGLSRRLGPVDPDMPPAR
jgi:hypothetical protein